MKALSLLAICLLMLGLQAKAQLQYTFKVSTAAYTPLTGATSATGGKLWDASTTFTLPLGFNLKINGTTTQTLYLSGSLLHTSMTSAKQNGFVLMSTGMTDRSAIQGTPKSAVRYMTTGTAGARIFKLELANVGFEDEFGKFGTLNDSANIQVWLYEGSNGVEFRYGSAGVKNFSEYFAGMMQTGFIKNLDTLTATFDKLYFLTGTPAAPSLDSLTAFNPSRGLSAFPANGQVYRFTPKGSSTGLEKLPAGSLATVFPTRCQNEIHIRNAGNAPLQAAIRGMDGRLALQTVAGTGDNGINLNALVPGSYILQLTDAAAGLSESQRIEKL